MADRGKKHCITTYPSGTWVDPARPDPGVLHPHDIAHSLARISRYAGCTSGHPYSVAQHSVLVSRLCPDPRWGLLHDGHEMIMQDVSSPLKRAPQMAGYVLLCEAWDRAMARRFKLGRQPKYVKDYDTLLLVVEMAKFKAEGAQSHDERDLAPGLRANMVPAAWLEPWSWERAKAEFLGRFVEVFSSW